MKCMQRLYRVGARKMVLVGIGPLGCIPSQLSMNNSTTGLCIQRVNDIVSAFNQLLLPLSTCLNSTLPGSFFVYHNTYDTFFDMVNNPSNYGEFIYSIKFSWLFTFFPFYITSNLQCFNYFCK